MLWSYMKESWLFFLLAPLLMVVEVVCDLYQPTLMANIIDIGVAGGDSAYIVRTAGVMLLVAALGLVGGFGCLYFSAQSTSATGARLRKSLFAHIQTFSFAELDRLQTSTLITRLTNDVTQVQNMLLSAQRILVRAPLLCVGGLVMAYALSPKLSVVFAVAVPVLCVVIVSVVRRAFGLFTTVQAKLDRLNVVTRETLLGIRVIKAFVTQDRQQAKFELSNEELLAWNVKAQRLVIVLMPFVTFVGNLAVIAVLWLGGHYVQAGTLEVGSIMAFITYILQVLQSLLMSMMIMVNISRAKASVDRINDVFAVEPAIREPEEPQPLTGYDLVFDHVYFRYHPHSDWVLQDISFTAKAGEMVGIIGATGSGKSTLAALIPRLYDAEKGRITLGGVDIRQLPLKELRRDIAMIMQDNVLFSGTIASNLRFGRGDADDELLIKTLEDAAAAELLTLAPEGLEAAVAQRGQNLSGGQKQRLTIARALIRSPKILILDDATSALDFATESRLQHNLRQRSDGCTTIMIAQRVSSLMHADRILVLDGGRIAAQGDHAALLKDCEIYRTIAETQLGEERVRHA